MIDVLTLMTRVLLSPLWALWWVYRFLWWTFSPDAPPAAAPAAGGKAFDIVDSRPTPPKLPVGALRGGFIGSLAASGGLAVLASTAARHDIVQPASAAAIWAWTSVLIFVMSIFAVRRVVLAKERKAARKHLAIPGVAVHAAKAAATRLKAAIDPEPVDHASPVTPRTPRLRHAFHACTTYAGKSWRWAASGASRAAAGARDIARVLHNPVRHAHATDAGPRG